jgi:MFS family permease
MVGIGAYIRLGITETPVFARIVAEERVGRAPSLEVIKRQPKQIILSAFARMGEQAPGYIYLAYIFTYGTTVVGASRDFLLAGLLCSAVLGFLWVPIAGHLSDRIGRKRMYIIAATIAGVFGFIYFMLLDTRSPILILGAILFSTPVTMNLYGPQAALIAESFTPRLRYSGAGIGYQLASIVAGGPAPFIAAALFAAFHSGYAIALYILGCAIVSVVATSLLNDHTNKDL